MHREVPLVAGVLLMGSSSLATDAFRGGPVTYEYGQAYVTIGDRGNRTPTLDEYQGFDIDGLFRPVGRVDYSYRMARTEVTAGQWREFLLAYLPFDTTGANSSRISGQYQNRFGDTVGWSFGQPVPNVPDRFAPEFAARYVNWLHNGKVNESWAFESGVYDTSTFGFDDDGNFTHDFTRSADARFWIPTIDEWVKAAYWDPDKDGEGGYWFMPDSGDEELLNGPPDQGGERNSREAAPDVYPRILDVGTFEDVLSPWGLLDTSGGVSEITSTRSPTNPNLLLGNGSDGVESTSGDPLNRFRSEDFDAGGFGLRLAAAVPSPSVSGLACIACLVSIRRKRL
jgi:hypothetical protein